MRKRLLLLSVLVWLLAPAVFSYAQVVPVAATTTASTIPVVPLVVATTTTQTASTSPSATTTTQNKGTSPSLLAAAAVVTEITTNTTLAPGVYTYDTLVIKSGATLTVQGDPLLANDFKGVRIEADSIIIEDGARISADQEGYDLVTRGPGAPAEAEYTKGASHGGLGDSATIGTRYGSAKQPITFGSSNQTRGGGAIQLVAHDELTIDGVVSANGGNTSSGGSIWIQTNSLRGHGVIRANGGDFSSFAAFIGPGGGGRVAAYYTDSSFTGIAEAQGGRRNAINSAEDGTVGFFETDTNKLTTGHAWRFQANDAPHTYTRVVAVDSVITTDSNQLLTITHLALSGLSLLTLTSGHDVHIGDLVVSNNSKIVVDQGSPLKISTLELKDQAVLTVVPLVVLNIEAGDVLIEADAKITLEQTGYAAGGGPGSPDDGDYYLGASYGGLGYGTLNPKPIYGSPTEPIDFGSGANQGRGGGALQLTVSDRLVNNGLIDANGGLSSSGGSLWVETKELSGIGRISANGGLYSFVAAYQVGPGAGGRIAVYYTDAAAWSGVIEAKGGRNPAGTAYAGDGSIVFQQKTFCTQNCNSSVLFLPGIMGSRLYEESNVCDVLLPEYKERERWMSDSQCDQQRLAMNELGKSKYAIYTRDENGSIIAESYLLNIYKSFLHDLQSWKNNDIYSDYGVLPYDWRLSIEDILHTGVNENDGLVHSIFAVPFEESLLYQKFSELASSSRTGKVNIVAHSNGGLLAKLFIQKLKDTNDPLYYKFDKIIFVGVPQVGTPEALLSLHHGSEIAGGFILEKELSRELTSNMPFAYNLLPSESYFLGNGSSVSTNPVTFDNSIYTQIFRNSYGESVGTFEELKDFTLGSEGRSVPAINDLNNPSRGNAVLYAQAEMLHDILSRWEVPPGAELHQVAGTGIPTVSGIKYSTGSQCLLSVLAIGPCLESSPVLQYSPEHVLDGDGTVVVPSALAISTSSENVHRWWVNIFKQNNNFTDREHKNLLEINELRTFIQNITTNSVDSTYDYITAVEPQINDVARLVFELHSPLDLSLRDKSGLQVSSSTNSISNAIYRRYGEVQYISVPDTGDRVSVSLKGYAKGSFTLKTERWTGEKLLEQEEFSAIPNATSTTASLIVEGNAALKTLILEVDFKGDGSPDYKLDTEGEVVKEISYQTLIDALNTLKIKSLNKQLLLVNARVAQEYNIKAKTKPKYKQLEILALKVLQQQVLLYWKTKIVSTAERDDIIKIINELNK